MIFFDKIPVLDREAFEDCFERASGFGVWIQINSSYQICLDITEEQAREIADRGFRGGTGPIWGKFSEYDKKLELSLNSQWTDRLKDV